MSASLKDILKSLIPDPLPKPSGEDDNAIHHLNIVIFGKPDTGKSSVAAEVYWTLVSMEIGTVRALRTSRDLPLLLDTIRESDWHKVGGEDWLLVAVADDMTKALDKLKGQVHVGDSTMGAKAYWLDRWYDIRGELKALGMNEGLAVMITTTHRFYGAPLDMRADVDLLLARSTGTPGTFDARFVEKALGKEAYEALKEHEVAALKNRAELGYTGWATKTGSGIVFIPRPQKQLPMLEKQFRSQIPTWYQWIPLVLGLSLWALVVAWLLRAI